MHKSTKKVLDVITESVNAGAAPPTLRELAKKAGFSSTWPVRYHLKKLAEEGFIKMKKNLSRSIEL
ncbi:MAG TPA: repressor LexA, partial [Candidatus Goldiibacteriota bacterium]|nr:repressor LexA [Candidatus Goldiibacteriota bacterium]